MVGTCLCTLIIRLDSLANIITACSGSVLSKALKLFCLTNSHFSFGSYTVNFMDLIACEVE